MVVKVGINGFGRIGRVIFRTCLQKPELEVAAINDPAIDNEYICYLIKFDSTHRKFPGTVMVCENGLNVNGKRVVILHEKMPTNIPWFSVGVQYVIDASGMFTNLEKASGHLQSDGVKRVVVTAPSVDIPMLIMGVNEDMIRLDHSVISCASSTLYCLAPIIKILEEHFGVTEGLVTSIHAMTPSLKPLDGLCLRGKHWRDHRSIHQNIIPAATGACKALNKIIPQIKDKLSGLAFRVPIVNVSVLDMSIRLNTCTSIQEIIKLVNQYSDTTMKNIIKTSNEESVSSDFLGEEHSCILDANSSFQLSPNFFKLVCWYENEYSYACRVIDTILFCESQSQRGFLPLDITPRITGTTTDRCKSVFIPNNYRYEINPDMITSASQDTGLKMKLSPKTFKNNKLGFKYLTTSTTLNEVVRKTNEVLNMSNNSMSRNEHGHLGSIFQSCVQFGPSTVQQDRCLKNKEQLEKIKQEFSKIVVLTEDLLKKSSHSRSGMDKTSDVTELASTSEVMTDIAEAQENVEIEKQKITIIEISKAGNEENELIKEPEVVPDTDKVIDKHDCICDTCDLPKTVVCTQIESSAIDNTCCDNVAVDVLSKCETKSIPSISEVISIKSFDLGINSRNKEDCKIALLDNQKEIICNVVQVMNNDEGVFRAPDKCNEFEEAEVEEVEPIITCQAASSGPEHDLDNDKNDSENQDIAKNTDDKELRMDAQTHTDANNDNLQSNKKLLESILRKISSNRVEIHSAGISQCESSCFSSLSNIRIRRTKQDIYDKLDSASATESENSFEINERKSQVINITDLTNSIEDLTRLDKICRIIEISDELSDKLFESLNSNELGGRQKTWSFKDLCERIKLDEFCNKVFGQ